MKRYFEFYVAVVMCVFAATLPAAAQPYFSPSRIPLIGEWREPAGDSFSFAILGDKTSGGEGKWPLFDQAVESINLLSPDFVITTGDQIPGHMEERKLWDREWAEYMEHAGRLKPPLILIPGNHDIANTACHRFWLEDFGAAYFSFMHKNCLFLVLNTEEERFDGRGPVWENMMAFAEEALRRHNEAPYTFLFFHKPMWADPRFVTEWKRLETALGDRRYTAVAGHEHYLCTSYSKGNPLVVMNATGGGMTPSEVRAFGCFQAFAHVAVRADSAAMAIIALDGGMASPDVAPASFRRAIDAQVVRLDAAPPEGLDGPDIRIHAQAALGNPFDKAIAVRLKAAPIEECGWRFLDEEGVFEGNKEQDAVLLNVFLEPGQSRIVSMPFMTAASNLATPPAVTWDVRYDGHWLSKERMPMEEINVVPLYPMEVWRNVPQWQVVGPFPIGYIDATQLPHSPEKANPNFFKRMGPESGYRETACFEDNLTWKPAASCGNGLLNHNAILGTAECAAAYSSVFVQSPVEQRTHALVYADNFAQVFVNGVLQESAQAIGAPGGFVYVPLAWESGWNTFVVKVINNRGDWFLRCLIADPQKNLHFSDTHNE